MALNSADVKKRCETQNVSKRRCVMNANISLRAFVA